MRKLQRELRRREPIEAATGHSAATSSAWPRPSRSTVATTSTASPAGSGLAEDRPRPGPADAERTEPARPGTATAGSPAAKPHRKGRSAASQKPGAPPAGPAKSDEPPADERSQRVGESASARSPAAAARVKPAARSPRPRTPPDPGPLGRPRRQARPTTRRCWSRPSGPPRRRQRTPTLALGRPPRQGSRRPAATPAAASAGLRTDAPIRIAWTVSMRSASCGSLSGR